MEKVEENVREEIKNNWLSVCKRARLAAEKCGRNPDDIMVLPVSKTHPFRIINAAMQFGVAEVGENYVQEMCDKVKFAYHENIVQPKWHFIGHLQSNKVKYIAPYITLVHSVDSVKVANELSKHGVLHNRNIEILLQVNTSGEESKSGCQPQELENIAAEVLKFSNVTVRGLMTIGSFSEDKNVSIKEFTLLRNLRDDLQAKFPHADFHHLSMGMTHDFETAIEQGSTIVRVGTGIFGQREYPQRIKFGLFID